MSEIITPNLLFKDFTIDAPVEAESISKTTENGIIREEFYLSGKKTQDGQVKIYAISFCDGKKEDKNAIILLGRISFGIDKGTLTHLAELGYYAIGIDLAGDFLVNKKHTIYPESLKHANYDRETALKTSIETNVYDTCWYQWDVNVKYLIQYVKQLGFVKKIGITGIATGAVVGWHILGTSTDIACGALCLNAGWMDYVGNYKYQNNVESNFTDNQIKFHAGIEPQTYAKNVKCPIYFMGATNSDFHECDRLFDTVSEVDDKVFHAINYSVGNREDISYETFLGVYKFLEQAFSQTENDKMLLPSRITVTLDDKSDENYYHFKIKTQEEGLKNICLFVAEKTIKPSLRCFRRHQNAVKEGKNTFAIDILKSQTDSSAVYFAKAEYEGDYGISSMIYYYDTEERTFNSKQKMIFSSRIEESESIFYPLVENRKGIKGINFAPSPKVKLVEGPHGIKGAYADGGLLSFIMSEKLNRPNENSMMILDVWSRGSGILTVRLVENYFGEKQVYQCNVEINGGSIWENVKLDRGEFKTVEGMALKNYEKIEGLEIEVNGEDVFEYAVNNILWI